MSVSICFSSPTLGVTLGLYQNYYKDNGGTKISVHSNQKTVVCLSASLPFFLLSLSQHARACMHMNRIVTHDFSVIIR